MRSPAVLIVFLAVGCVHPTQLVLPLSYSPKESFTSNRPDSVSARLVALEIVPLLDARAIENRAVVGENREHTPAVPIVATSSVADFATSVLRRCLGEWGLRLGPGGALLHGEITNLFVSEDFTYSTVVTIRFRLERDGKTNWEGIVTGNAKQFGKSLSVENYNEQLSSGLKQTFANLVDAPGFQAALAR